MRWALSRFFTGIDAEAGKKKGSKDKNRRDGESGWWRLLGKDGGTLKHAYSPGCALLETCGRLPALVVLLLLQSRMPMLLAV